MFKGHVRSLALVVVVLWSGIAHANLTANDVAFGLRSITGGTFTLPDTIAGDSTTGDLLDHIGVTGTGCSVVTVVSTETLPRLITDTTPLDIDVKFDPVDRIAVTCTVTLFDVLNNSLGTFTVDGDGAGPAISVPPTSFGTVRVSTGATSNNDVVITNDGEETLSITNLAIDLGDYTFTNAPTFPIDIPATMSASVNITFDPSASGSRDGTLTITSNNTGSSTTTASLTGTGANAVINVTDVSFNDVTDNTTSTLATTITNTGTPLGTLKVMSASISGGSWFTFADNGNGCAGMTSCTFANLTVDGTPKTVDVRCSPLSTDPLVMQSATLTFTSDADSGTGMALLTCVAGRPNITGVPATLPFGDVLINTSSSPQTVTVQNTGNRDLTYSVTKSGASAASYTLGGSCVTSCTVAPSSSDSFTVTFSPTAAGQQDITVTVTSNDPDTMTKDIDVTGRGVAPAISGPLDVQFNDVEVGKTSAAKQLTVTNTGTSTLTITSGTVFSGTSDYTVTANPPSLVVAPNGGTATWDLVCNPSAQGSRPGTFRILSDAQNTPMLDVPLACNGTRGFLEVDPTSLAFGNVPQDTTVDMQVLLKNTGNLPVAGITASVNPNNVGYSVVAATLPSSLNAMSNQMVTIRFAPTSTATGGAATVTFQGTFGAAPVQTTSAALGLTGTGQTANVTLDKTSIDFGNFRYDLTPTQTFCITNSGQSPVEIQSTMFLPNAGTASNEFVVSQILKQATCGMGGSAVTLPNTLTAGEIVEVTVRAQPANRTGPLNGDLRITTNLPVNPVKTVALAGNSITAMLTLVPGATVSFGDVDIQGAAQMITVRLRNTGQAPLDLGSFTRTPNTAFTFTLPAGTQVVQPNGEIMFAVTYAPTIALAGDETVTISHSIAGDIALPAMGMIVLRGHPIDRDLEILGIPLYPDTFRNPGTDGPVRVVQVHNRGSAPLQISSIAATDPVVWKVLDPDPITIPADATADIRVRFEPIAPGRADARLQIVNDDDDDGPPITTKTTEVTLSGNCVARGVTFGPERIELGYVEIGASVTQEDILKVIRTDADHTFTLTKIAIEGDDQFAVDGFTDGMQLDDMERDFDVTFTPRVAGPASAKIRLFLDQDPVHQAEIEVTGTAVFVDARGGGGCAATNGSGLGAIIVVLLLVLRRRAAAVAVLALAATAARADDNIALSVFEPTPATSTDGFQLQSATVGNHGDWVLGAVYSYASKPLLHIASEGGEHGVITGSSLLDVGVAVALLHRFELGATMPFYSQSGEARGNSLMGYTTDPADGTATGDLRVHAKVSVVRASLSGNGSFGLSGGFGLTIPTATDGMLAGVDNPSARVLALATLVPGAFDNRITISANAGAVIRAAAEYKNIEQKSGVMWGLGTTLRIADPLWLAAEMFGEFTPSGRTEMDGASAVLAPIEWLGGVHWRPDRRFMVSLAAGRGLTSAAGAPALRGVFALTITPNAGQLKPIHPPPPEDVTDTDGDGVLDRADQCDNEPEDKDLYDDTDGCPDPDNDRDGIADAQDRCPIEAEDKDGFQDEDGCVEKDNDADKIADAMDKCPSDPEDNDGFQDGDGCPDADNDGDGVVDVNDKCPAQKETINGNQDNDGCPDPGISLVVVTLDRFDLMESIQFTGDKVKSSSFNLLGQIAATLRARPDILRVRLAVHVSDGRSDEKDQQLSDRRAASLREWLVQWGIEAKRLDVRGFGSSKPLGGSAAANERVEIVIMEKK